MKLLLISLGLMDRGVTRTIWARGSGVEGDIGLSVFLESAIA